VKVGGSPIGALIPSQTRLGRASWVSRQARSGFYRQRFEPAVQRYVDSVDREYYGFRLAAVPIREDLRLRVGSVGGWCR
jgi:hypothetical protein